MGAIKLLELALFLNLFSNPALFCGKEKPQSFPPSCNRIECPSYDLIEEGNGFEIRRYNSSVWASTSKIDDISLVQATRTGFLQLFNYIQGKNDDKKKIEMTAPVITQVSPSDGPLCESSFVVSFYVPKENQANPPSSKGLHIQKWEPTYVAVRQFGGFVSDYAVGEEAAILQSSLAGSKWAAAIEKSQKDNPKTSYTVAGYNSPFEIFNRVNEIWFNFDMDNVADM
ncbi:hypothetical protein SOVF_034180 [Spinacia oleracea]|uniref:Heme-binding protein 2 n=1 Tax=Spinacia oleracea TaxID=3562 RepID=A0A9R0JIA4_SPIOL|nr:uncharacterized protein LOC110805716 [Spinacia oleracea]KNA22285.1 hypothetical protein SOVF_034180 [Spinacia oleracea]